MADLEESFALLLGRQATEKERQNLYRVRDALKLKGNDALWLLLMVLEYYRTFYERIPALITEAARAATRDVQAMAAAQITAAVEAAKAAVSRAAAEASAAAAKRESQRINPLKWATGCIVASTGCLTLVASLAYSHGQVAGFATGSEVAQRRYANAAALASWANTPEGELGYAFAKAGSLRELATCSGRGWVQRDEVCYATSKAQGWRLPARPERVSRE
jgi:hypothetical protein